MKQIKKIRKVGSSLMIAIDPDIIKKMKIKEGNSIKIDVIRIIDFDEKIRTYKCKKCGYESQESEYCPSCQQEGAQKEVKKE